MEGEFNGMIIENLKVKSISFLLKQGQIDASNFKDHCRVNYSLQPINSIKIANSTKKHLALFPLVLKRICMYVLYKRSSVRPNISIEALSTE